MRAQRALKDEEAPLGSPAQPEISALAALTARLKDGRKALPAASQRAGRSGAQTLRTPSKTDIAEDIERLAAAWGASSHAPPRIFPLGLLGARRLRSWGSRSPRC